MSVGIILCSAVFMQVHSCAPFSWIASINSDKSFAEKKSQFNGTDKQKMMDFFLKQKVTTHEFIFQKPETFRKNVLTIKIFLITPPLN